MCPNLLRVEGRYRLPTGGAVEAKMYRKKQGTEKMVLVALSPMCREQQILPGK